MENKVRVIVDTNIIFSALRSKKSSLRGILLKEEYSFHAPNYIIFEIFKHKEDIFKKAKASEDEIYEFLNLVLQKIHFISEEFVSKENRIKAYKLCKDVDEDDTPFVALSLEFEAKLWTGDKKLKKDLTLKGFDNFFIPS